MRWWTGNALCKRYLIRGIFTTLAGVSLRIKFASFETILAFERCCIPELFTWAFIAMLSVEKGEIKRTSLAEHCVNVIALIIGAFGAGESLEVPKGRVDALQAGFVVPKIGLFLKAVACLSRCVIFASWPAN